MSLPTISPTGALASGDYVEYMISYMDGAITSLDTQLATYLGDKTTTDWYSKWDEILDDIDAKVTTLNSDIAKIQTQITMAKNAADAL